jgi:hypothetical protein
MLLGKRHRFICMRGGAGVGVDTVCYGVIQHDDEPRLHIHSTSSAGCSLHGMSAFSTQLACITCAEPLVCSAHSLQLQSALAKLL